MYYIVKVNKKDFEIIDEYKTYSMAFSAYEDIIKDEFYDGDTIAIMEELESVEVDIQEEEEDDEE